MEDLEQLLRNQGVALIGYANLAPLDPELRRGYPRAVSIAWALNPRIIAGIAEGPTEDYCDEYDRVNAMLGDIATEAAEFLLAGGWQAESVPPTGEFDRTTLAAPFQNKTAATLAGLGWIGRSALLITSEFGPAVRWASVLTNAPLPVGTPITESRCGDCDRCVRTCPGHAPSGKLWTQGMAREDFWDVGACLQGMKQASSARAVRLGICGMCVACCPHTIAYLKRAGAL